MTTLYADFNARTADDRVRLNVVGSQESLAATNVQPGTWVWLSDGEVRAGALLENGPEGLVARVSWETAEDVVPTDSILEPAEVSRALRELKTVIQDPDRDYRRVLQLIPVAERGLQPGRGDYYRSRVAQAFGYPRLALLAIENALERAPATPGFVHQRLNLLKTIDLDLAMGEAQRFVADPLAPAVVLVACATIYDASARQLDEVGGRHRLDELLNLTDRFSSAPGYDMLPLSAVATVHVIRGFALLHLGNRRDEAIAEFSKAIEAAPESAEAFAARGLETYPAESGIRDLERAVELEISSFWPAYYLAHHCTQEHSWARAQTFAGIARRLGPPPRVLANLLEWEAIARFQLGGDLLQARAQLQEALDLAPGNAHLRRNLQTLDRLALAAASDTLTDWEVTRDEEKVTADVQAAA